MQLVTIVYCIILQKIIRESKESVKNIGVHGGGVSVCNNFRTEEKLLMKNCGRRKSR
jgi:hypothetical protein